MIMKRIQLIAILFVLLIDTVTQQQQQQQQQLFQIGPGPFVFNNIRQKKSQLIFISRDVAPSSGILVGFTTYVQLANKTFDFQIWRPVSTGTSDYKLIFSVSYLEGSANFAPGFREILLSTYQASSSSSSSSSSSNNKCIYIQPKDRLGVYFKDDVWPLPYMFISDDNLLSGGQDQRSFMLDISQTGSISVGQVARLDELVFPYKFPMAAWVLPNAAASTGGSNSNDLEMVACPPGLTLPSMVPPTTTTPLPTPPRTGPKGPDGDTGAPGPVGDTGYPGDTGFQGFTGSTGATGLQGSTGGTGDVGAVGLVGFNGLNGQDGNSGDPGVEGVVGATGVKGQPGLRGPNGVDAFVYYNITDDEEDDESSSSGRGGSGQWNQPLLQRLPDSEARTWWQKESFVKGMFAWAAILSFIIVVEFIWSLALLCVIAKKKN